ncbi:hypothetical protein [Comamonas sp. MYb69]|uniref:hypothetical protein n=1 Tax=Comamonas sp. MYb69 TaxID=1848650 RepID=UPI0030965691
MNMLLIKMMKPLNEAGEGGSDAGGTATAVEVLDDDEGYMQKSAEERARLRGDDARGAVNPEALAAVLAKEDASQLPSDARLTDAEDADASTNSGTGIPRARFNEVNDRRKALETEVEQLRAQLASAQPAAGAAPARPPQQAPQAAPEPYDIEAAEELYLQLVLDGDTKAATKLRMEINGVLQDAAYSRFAHETAAQQQTAAASKTVEALLQSYPWLEGPEGVEAMDLIEASVIMKVSRGTSQAQALKEAVNAIAPRFAPGAHPIGGVRPDTRHVDIRPQRANERGALDSQLQPAQLQAGLGNRATAPQIDGVKLTDEEYEALPEAERKKLRGDAV